MYEAKYTVHQYSSTLAPNLDSKALCKIAGWFAVLVYVGTCIHAPPVPSKQRPSLAVGMHHVRTFSISLLLASILLRRTCVRKAMQWIDRDES